MLGIWLILPSSKNETSKPNHYHHHFHCPALGSPFDVDGDPVWAYIREKTNRGGEHGSSRRFVAGAREKEKEDVSSHLSNDV